MISVILTTHNKRKDRCKQAIQSVLAQSFQDYELIVVDDGSKDGTEEMVIGFRNRKITYIHRTECFGNDTKPKNEGILASKGEYIAFLDSDNTWRPDHLQVLYNAITRNDVDVVYGDRWLIDERGEIPAQLGVSSDYSSQMLIQRNFIDTSDVLIRRQALFDVGGWDERYKKYVDWNLWVRMDKYGKKFLHVPMIITDYHLCSDSKSFRKEDEKAFSVPAWNPYDVEIELPYLREVKPPRVAVYSLTYDRIDYTQRCFQSLNETAGYPFTHFIYDNGSKDGTTRFLEKYYVEDTANRSVIYSQKNNGISVGSNRILDVIKDYDIIVKVDNDCLFKTNGWLSKMVELYQSNHKLILSPYIEGLRDNPGGAPRIHRGEIKKELIGITKHLGGICVFAPATAYEDFRWDESSFLHGVQDVEFSRHVLSKGYTLGYLENYYAEHYEGTIGQEKRYPQYFERRKKEKVTRYEP